MTRLLDHAVEAVRGLPAEMAGEEQPAIQLTTEEEASLEELLAQAERGELATDEQMRTIWAKHGL